MRLHREVTRFVQPFFQVLGEVGMTFLVCCRSCIQGSPSGIGKLDVQLQALQGLVVVKRFLAFYQRGLGKAIN